MVPRRAAQPRLEPRGATTTRRRAFPYEDLVAENGRRGKLEPEYELLDTGVFDDDRYWVGRGRLRQGRPARPADGGQRRPTPAPTRRRCTCCRRLWFRNTWSWDVGADRPRAAGATATAPVAIDHPFLGELELRG